MRQSYATLEDAVLANDDPRRERPFRCHVHPDSRASASVNVIKRLWVCYTCQARGKVGEVIETNFQQAMNDVFSLLEEDNQAEVSEEMMTLYTSGEPHPYWKERFRDDAIRHFQLGTDPDSGRPCYPMRDPGGTLQGMVMRNLDRHPKYKYPRHCKANQQLWNYTTDRRRQVVLVEGAMDVIAAWEVGIDAFGIYGSHLSDEQVALILKVSPKWVHLAFDNDEAGQRCSDRAREMLEVEGIAVSEFPWREYPYYKDIAELEPGKRRVSLSNLLVP